MDIEISREPDACPKVPILDRLSPEMRNVIWEMCVTQDDIIVICAHHYSGPISAQGNLPMNYPVALTAVCKQIRNECTQLFYASNAFYFYFKAADDFKEWQRDEACLLQRFCSSIPEDHAASLRRVVVYIQRQQPRRHRTHLLDDIQHQFSAIRQFSESHPLCDVTCRFSCSYDVHTSMLPPIELQFRDGVDNVESVLQNTRAASPPSAGPYGNGNDWARKLQDLETLLEKFRLEREGRVPF